MAPLTDSPGDETVPAYRRMRMVVSLVEVPFGEINVESRSRRLDENDDRSPSVHLGHWYAGTGPHHGHRNLDVAKWHQGSDSFVVQGNPGRMKDSATSP